MALVDDYQAAVASGDSTTANYLAQMLAAQAGININTNEVTAAPNSMVNPTTSSSGLSGILGNTESWLNEYLPSDSANNAAIISTTAANPVNQAIQSGIDTVGGAVSTASGFFNFIGDIPRLGTTIIGGLMIAAGLFGLAGGSHKDVINLVTSKTKAVASGAP